MYADVLTCLTRDPLAGNVSPALIGSQGTIPLSIVSTIPDIMQHYKDCSESDFHPQVSSRRGLTWNVPSSSRSRREGGLSRDECVPSVRNSFSERVLILRLPPTDYWQCVETPSTGSSRTDERTEPGSSFCRPSDSVSTIASGLRELNRRVGERNGQRIVVKIMWDRGAVPQLWQ
jgi:hypothetical protein